MWYQSQVHFYMKGTKQLALNVFGTVHKECGKSASMDSVIKKMAALTHVSEHAL